MSPVKFVKALKHFGEDQLQLKPDVFFGTFDTFITAFAEAKQDNKNMAKRKEEEEKRALAEAQVGAPLPPLENHTRSLYSFMAFVPPPAEEGEGAEGQEGCRGGPWRVRRPGLGTALRGGV